jgi:Zn-finger nucleic acid-binding protein
MGAKTLNCPTCGAAVTGNESSCRYCGARLATVACPSCFGMMFAGSKHCPHCGGAASRGPAEDVTGVKCPDCEVPLVRVALRETVLAECARCFGIWLDTGSFNRICVEREQQAAVLGRAEPQEIDVKKAWRYLPCPACGHLMHRVNFAGQSGVIIDLCKDHGVWFEREELRKIVEFIRAGGMTQARETQLERLEHERRRLENERRDATAESMSRADAGVWGTNDAGANDALRITLESIGRLFSGRW